jgi:signal transduction histidine kinase
MAPRTAAREGRRFGLVARMRSGATATLPSVTGALAQAHVEHLLGAERVISRVRWGAAAFALFEVLTYGAVPWPGRAREAGMFLALALVAGNALILRISHRVDRLDEANRLALASLALDAAVTIGYVWVFAFDRQSAQWLVLVFLPLEAATRFRLSGAVLGWLVATGGYIAREQVMTSSLGEAFPASSIGFRMGIILLVALIAGGMVEGQHRQRLRAERAAANLRRLDTLRRNLVATLAHDVRAPLTAIRGTLELLGKADVTLDDGQRAEVLALADRQTRRLSALMFDLLDQARLETGHLEVHRSEFPVAEVVAEVLGYMDPERRFRVDVPADLRCVADARRVEQILANLVSNALRYGAAPFLISARATPEGGVEMAVEDHGPGIDALRLTQLFEPFEAEPGHDEESVGLGLWIARSLAERHGGNLTNDPIDDSGARFVVHLPVAVPDEVVGG